MKIKLGHMKNIMESKQDVYIKTFSNKIYYMGKIHDLPVNLLEQEILHMLIQVLPDPQDEDEELIPKIPELVIWVESTPKLDKLADERAKILRESFEREQNEIWEKSLT